MISLAKKGKLKVVSVLLAFFMVLSAFAVPVFADDAAYVGTYDELKRAIENPAVTHIYLTSNILLGTEVTYLNTDRPELVIDGMGYSIYDANILGLAFTFQVIKPGALKDITVQNVRMVGRNHYGFISIPDSLLYDDMTLTYDNIEYTGPQLAWARKSTVVLNNSNITIVPGFCNIAEEVAEALHVVLSGNVNIVKDAPLSGLELFWITYSSGGITVAENAVVNVSSNQLQRNIASKTSGFAFLGCDDLYMTFDNDSVFNYVGNNMFVECDDVDRFVVGQRAEVNITTRGNFYGIYGQFGISHEMVVETDAIVNLLALENQNIGAVIQMKDRSQLVLDSPKQFFVYNSSRYTSNYGLAVGSMYGYDTVLSYNDIKTLEYWRLNASPYDDLRQPTYIWQHTNDKYWGLNATVRYDNVMSVTPIGYRGTYPISTSTLSSRNVNVIRVNGGTSPIIHAVNFETNGGTPVPAVQNITDGGVIAMPTTPTRTGYTFGGWYADPGFGGEAWDFATNTVTSAMTLFAKWEAEEIGYSIAYYTDSVSAANQIELIDMGVVPYGTSVILTAEQLDAFNPDPSVYNMGIQVENPVVIESDGQVVEVVYEKKPIVEANILIEHFVQMGSLPNGQPMYYLVEETLVPGTIGQETDVYSMISEDIVYDLGYSYSHATYRGERVEAVEVSENMIAVKIFYVNFSRRMMPLQQEVIEETVAAVESLGGTIDETFEETAPVEEIVAEGSASAAVSAANTEE